MNQYRLLPFKYLRDIERSCDDKFWEYYEYLFTAKRDDILFDLHGLCLERPKSRGMFTIPTSATYTVYGRAGAGGGNGGSGFVEIGTFDATGGNGTTIGFVP